jgi:uncharacterized protein YcfL
MNRLLPVLLCLLASCAAPTGGAAGSDAVLSVQPSGPELKAELSSFVRSTGKQQGRMVVGLDLKNSSDRAIDFAWAIEWMDRAGGVLSGTPSEWRSLRLESGAMTPIEIEAPHPSAASWRLITLEM